MADLIDTTEMYLRTILELEEEGIVPLRARISERLGHSGPTVSQTIARMERDGLVVVTDDRHLELTDAGRTKSVQVMRKHRLAERLLADVIGLEWEYVHEEACRWEHVMSEQVERKLLDILGQPTESPYGNPIPGLDELGVRTLGYPSNAVNAFELVSDQIDDTQAVRGTVRRLTEGVQVDPETLRELAAAGVKPGAAATFTLVDNRVLVDVEGVEGSIDLPIETASHVFVSPALP